MVIVAHQLIGRHALPLDGSEEVVIRQVVDTTLEVRYIVSPLSRLGRSHHVLSFNEFVLVSETCNEDGY